MKIHVSGDWIRRMAKLEEEAGDITVGSLGPRRIIFLDVDGVLNSEQTWGTTCENPPDDRSEKLEPGMVERLKRIIAETGAKIVVSSSWRISHYDRLITRLTEYGLPVGTIIDKTVNAIPDSNKESLHHTDERGQEIAEWLSRHPFVDEFLIIDDSNDMNPVMNHLVQTTWAHGLQNKHVKEILRRFATGRAQYKRHVVS